MARSSTGVNIKIADNLSVGLTNAGGKIGV